MFTKHDISPDVFYKKDDMARRLLLAFSDYEIEKENKAAEQAAAGR
ncbi:hypothetical protein G8V05_05195 [Clostridium botulinum C/D]|nr:MULTISPECIES: hypothetical protein [Clostridium]MCD3230905.1 hypothetical protein [Clostridium botulinum C/D]MCD3253909.1 hypothetical protein [Clostridium botulinum C/D]MCD3279409.1 hypothetical protein [Clostridium botulinum C/D]MCD3281612.1 hypothetical protein [Clostridium botulinum C/D]MCD3339148.1 hypothetical protein [Clostridium botulinum C/D]